MTAQVPGRGRADSMINVQFEEDVPEIDSSASGHSSSFAYVLRPVPADSLEKIRSEKIFDYRYHLDSLLRARNEEIKATLSKPAPRPPSYSFDFLRQVLWVMALLAFLFVVYSLFFGHTAIFRRNRKNVDLLFNSVAETEKDNLAIYKANAVKQGNYRMAVRYAYLELLELLDTKKIIDNRGDKTNYQLVMEVKRQPWANDFAAITLKYEYVWYGKYTINAQQYEFWETELEALKKQLK
jgi:hypothetical protein